MPKPLVIVPAYSTQAPDLEVLNDCVKSLRASAGDFIDILIVDDSSPDKNLQNATQTLADGWGADCVIQPENGGFSRAVNVGLRRALRDGADAILANADLEITSKKDTWLRAMVDQPNLDKEGKAFVVGGLLSFPDRLIQHAGIYFSLLTRTFDHLYKYAPVNLPAAQKERVCPVTGAFQFIRHDCLEEIGLYDESFPLGWEDVDYCIRVLRAGHECVYQPRVRALHHESLFRGRPNERLQKRQLASFLRLMEKYQDQSFAGLVPFL